MSKFNGMEITEVNIHPVKEEDPSDNYSTAATVRIVFNEMFVINQIRVVKGKFGLFVSFPRSYDTKAGKGFNYCFPITKSFHEYLSEKILSQYRSDIAAKEIAG